MSLLPGLEGVAGVYKEKVLVFRKDIYGIRAGISA